MFSLISGLYNSYNKETNISILLVGCDGAGKTSLLERCKVTDLKHQNNGSIRRSHKTSSQSNNNSNYESTSSKYVSIDDERHNYCPSPASYRHSAVFDKEDEDLEISEKSKPQSSTDQYSGNGTVNPAEETLNDQLGQKEGNENEVDVDIVRGAKMFPLDMIKPTVGMNLAKLPAFGCKCSFWDLGGKKQMQALWERYYADADAVVFVVDVTSNADKINEAREAFHSVKKDEQLAGVPILIFANKVDALSESNEIAVNEFVSKLNIFPFEQRYSNKCDVDDLDDKKFPGMIGFDGIHLIRLCHGSAKTGAGIKDALEWLISTAKDQSLHSGAN